MGRKPLVTTDGRYTLEVGGRETSNVNRLDEAPRDSVVLIVESAYEEGRSSKLELTLDLDHKTKRALVKRLQEERP